uniref:DND microRNA-mediated repression inhibitor 1 n=1 Tax=Crocodylus porosus TaxID=8502 RepID=A0A7M4DX27_CROPO
MLMMWSDTINQANKTALLAWVKETGIHLVQVNGQRKYGGPPPGWVGDPPPSGSEVFIGKLPQDMYENKLIPLFQSVGKLYEFRLMMTFSGLNRGFAYAKYSDCHSAQVAITTLNNFEVQKGCLIMVCKSIEKCELCMDGLPSSVNLGQLQMVLQEVTTGVENVSLYPNPSRKRGRLAVLKYHSHRAAAMAKKTLAEGNLDLHGEEIHVDWLKPEMKQKLRNSLGKTSSEGLKPDGPLGEPVYLTKCVQVNPDGWMRFWYQVVIPGYPSPFSGFIWIKPEQSGLSEHEKAKNAAAFQVLKTLGEQVALLWTLASSATLLFKVQHLELETVFQLGSHPC